MIQNPNRCRYAAMEAARLQALEGAEPTTRPAKKTLDQQFIDHQAACPPIPRGLHPDDPVFIEWYLAFSAWAATKARLQARLSTRGLRFDNWGRCIRTGAA